MKVEIKIKDIEVVWCHGSYDDKKVNEEIEGSIGDVILVDIDDLEDVDFYQIKSKIQEEIFDKTDIDEEWSGWDSISLIIDFDLSLKI